VTIAGYLNLRRTDADPAQPAPPGASEPVTTSPQPSPTASPSTPTAGVRSPTRPVGRTTTAPPATTSGTITSPADLADVQSCAYFTGTATLPPGQTLILAKRNITNGLPDRYVEFVHGWDEPQTTWAWRGAQYFSTGNDADGQQFRVELMAVDLTAAKAARTTNEVNDLATIGSVLAGRTVNRIPGTAPQDPCEGP
jgi:serine/threonine-protein kinase